MAHVLVNETYLTNIANAIIQKGGASAPITPSKMAKAITSIPSGTLTSNLFAVEGSFTPLADITAVDIPVTFTPYLIAVWTTPSNMTYYTGFRMMLIVKDEIEMNAFDSVTSSATPLYYGHDSAIVGYNDEHVDREAYAVLSEGSLRVVSGNSYYLSKFKAGEKHKYIIVGSFE